MRTEITRITNRLNENFKKNNKIRAFVFGSAIRANETPNDIDILIVYDDITLPQKVRNILEGTEYIPIHLIFLTPQEETETNFIKKQNCISIF